MSSLFKQFKMSEAKEQEGIEITYSPNEDGTVPTFRIRRISRTNQMYVKMLERHTRPVRRQIELETLPNLAADRIRYRVFADSILLGWQNVQDADNQPITFNADAAAALFEKLPELYFDLEAQASKASLFVDETLESDAKN